MAKRYPGRPTKITDIVLKKLEESYAFGASDKEACFYADISPAALYKYQERNPKFVERKELLKERPVLLARQSVVKALENDPALALKYLERKRRKEFALRSEVTGEDGSPLMPIGLDGAILARMQQRAEAAQLPETDSGE